VRFAIQDVVALLDHCAADGLSQMTFPTATRSRSARTTPEQPVSCGETEPRLARALQDPQLMSKGENLELQRRPRAYQRTERHDYGDDDGHHRSKAMRW